MPGTAEINAGTMVKDAVAQEGKYLTFALGREEYGLEILKVREIIGYLEVTSVPQMPDHVKGVINLRGQVIPVVDLRSKFNMDATQITEETCIIVVEIGLGDSLHKIGMIVDHVLEVLDIESEDIEEAPPLGSGVNTSFILGLAKLGSTVKILLNIDQVLSAEDKDMLHLAVSPLDPQKDQQ